MDADGWRGNGSPLRESGAVSGSAGKPGETGRSGDTARWPAGAGAVRSGAHTARNGVSQSLSGLGVPLISRHVGSRRSERVPRVGCGNPAQTRSGRDSPALPGIEESGDVERGALHDRLLVLPDVQGDYGRAEKGAFARDHGTVAERRAPRAAPVSDRLPYGLAVVEPGEEQPGPHPRRNACKLPAD